MSDTLTNALQQSAHSSTVLQGLMNPATLNPLAGMGSAISTVSGMQGLAAKQGEQLVGQALQQATDENGVLDVPKAMRIAAGMGPNAAFAMQGFLKTGSQLRGEQITQGGAVNTSITRAGASVMQDSSDANVNATFDNLIATNPGQRQLYETERQRVLAMQPQQRVQYAYQHVLGQMDAADQLNRGGYGAPVMTQFGGTSAPVVSTPGSPYRPAGTAIGGGVAHTQDPATYYGPQPNTVWVDGNGQETTDPAKVAHVITRDIPRGPAMGAPPPGSVGGPQGGGGPPPAAPSPAPGALPPGAPPPLPGQHLVIKNGQFVTPPPAPTPATTTTTPPPAGTPPAPAAARPSPIGGVITSPPQGQPDLLAKDNEVRTQANLAMEDQQKRLIAGNSALEALKLADTGPSTGFFARAYAFLKAQGITTVERGQLSDTDYRQLLQKNLLRFAQTGAKTSGTNLGLETQIHSNANVDDMLAGANRHVLIQDLGVLKRSIAQTQEMPTSGPAGSVVKHVGEFSAKVAPEAFMWDQYTDAEREAIKKDYEDKGKTQQLEDSVHLAIRRGAIPPPRARPAVVAPPAQPPNALVPTN